MKKKVNVRYAGFIVVLLALILIGGCEFAVTEKGSGETYSVKVEKGSEVGSSKAATFGEGDTKFSVELVDSKYELSDAEVGSGKFVILKGNLKLKICNKGEKELPFVLDRDSGGIFIDFKPEDVQNVESSALAVFERKNIESDEGFISVTPGKCPTYPFSFDSGILSVDESEGKNKIKKAAYKNAKYYFFLGDKKFALKGVDNTVTEAQAKQTLDNSLKAAGLTEESARALLLQIAQDAPIDKCQQGANEVACLSAAWEYAFKKGIPAGQEVACELVRAEEIKALCKSGVVKSLTQVEQKFNQYAK